MLSVSEKGYAFVACREACVLTMYPDSHNPAIGFGQNDPSLKPGDTITLDRAVALFVQEGQRIAAALPKFFPGLFVEQHVNALFSLVYNVGLGTIRDDDALRDAVAAFLVRGGTGLLDAVGERILLCHPKDKPVPFNESRRRLEIQLFETGDYGDISKMMLWTAGKSPRNTPPDHPIIVPMPTFLKVAA